MSPPDGAAATTTDATTTDGAAIARPRRAAIVDLGSNSVRLVVFEGDPDRPVAIFNEKATLRLGKGLEQTGRLNPEGVAQALDVMARFHAVARAMHADPFEVLATAAARDAVNGPEFIRGLEERSPGVPIRILTGAEEAAYAAGGLLAGLPQADGILADIGGGSLELVHLERGTVTEAASLPLGVLRLGDRAGGDLGRARAIVEADLGALSWLDRGAGRDLYLVGGAFRALARLHMAETLYPLRIVHHYAIEREEARAFAGGVPTTSRRAIERVSGLRRRAEDLPFAAVVLRRLLRAAMPRRAMFSAHGLREGWFRERTGGASPGTGGDPMLAASRELGRLLGRDPGLPGVLTDWIAPLFPGETADERRLREAACALADIGSHDHPEYRDEQVFLRVLRQPGAALEHRERAFLALAVAIRYDAEPDAPFVADACALLDPDSLLRAEATGFALRLATHLSAGIPALLSGARLERDARRLELIVTRGQGLLAGDSTARRLDRLAASLGLNAVMTVAVA